MNEKGMKKTDVIATVLLAIVLIILGPWGWITILGPILSPWVESNQCAGMAGIMVESVPFILWLIILPAFVIIEGKRIRDPIICVVQAMILNLLFVGAIVPFYSPPPFVERSWYEDPGMLVALIVPTGALGLLALSSTGVAGVERKELIWIIGFLGGFLFFVGAILLEDVPSGFVGGFLGFLIFGGLAALLLPRGRVK